VNNFIWSQSALKDLEKDETCPFRWKEQWVERKFNSKASPVMDQGNFFEYLCIGGNAKGEAITSIPLTLKNEKTAVQKRIEKQAELFHKMFDPTAKEFLGYKIVGTQVKLSGAIDGNLVEGTADILATRLSDGARVIIDLKLTDDGYRIGRVTATDAFRVYEIPLCPDDEGWMAHVLLSYLNRDGYRGVFTIKHHYVNGVLQHFFVINSTGHFRGGYNPAGSQDNFTGLGFIELKCWAACGFRPILAGHHLRTTYTRYHFRP